VLCLIETKALLLSQATIIGIECMRRVACCVCGQLLESSDENTLSVLLSFLKDRDTKRHELQLDLAQRGTLMLNICIALSLACMAPLADNSIQSGLYWAMLIQ